MSGHEHLSEDALLDAVYGIAGNAAEAHLRRCADCAQRLQEWHEKRAAAVESVEISSDFLAAQRKKIYERIERPSRKHWLWAPGLAAACALAIGLFRVSSGSEGTAAAGMRRSATHNCSARFIPWNNRSNRRRRRRRGRCLRSSNSDADVDLGAAGIAGGLLGTSAGRVRRGGRARGGTVR